MTAPAGVCLTGDELTTIARCLGAPRFPGVLHTSYDLVGEDRHAGLDRRCLASLAARGLLTPDREGGLWPTDALATLIDAAATHRTYIAVEQGRPATDPGVSRTCSIMVGLRGIVRHGIAEPLHVLELDPRTTALEPRLGSLLGELVDRSQGSGRPGRRRCRGRRSGLADLVPAPAGGWLRATALARTDDAGGRAQVEGFLAVFDGGPGDLWLVTADDTWDDPYAGPGEAASRSVLAEPASSSEIDAAIQAFASLRPTSWLDRDPPEGGTDRWRS